jgi:hypothetical protein
MSRSTAPRRHHTKVHRSALYLVLLETMSQNGSTRVSNSDAKGGIFKLELFLPDDYPMTPPKIRFLTKIFHPNVDKLGRICLDVLKSRFFFAGSWRGRAPTFPTTKSMRLTQAHRQLVACAADPDDSALYPGPPRRPQPR